MKKELVESIRALIFHSPEDELKGRDSSRRPSVRSHFQTLISLRPEGRSQSNFIWSVIGVGERLQKVWERSDQNSGFYGNR